MTRVVHSSRRPARISLLCVVGRHRDTRSRARWIADHSSLFESLIILVPRRTAWYSRSCHNHFFTPEILCRGIWITRHRGLGPGNDRAGLRVFRFVCHRAPAPHRRWIQQNNWVDFKTYCASSGCAFQHLGTTRTKDGSCYPGMSVVPNNMHPEVLKAGDSWYERYQFGKWETFHVDDSNQHTVNCHEPCSHTLGSTIVRGKRVIRMDDYPFPSAMPIAEQQSKLAVALNILESNDIPYVLGVSPMQLLLKGELDDHVRFLNLHVRRGFVCMHGFDHRTNAGTDDVDPKIWEIGGEFAKYSPRELQDQWSEGDAILRRIDRYTTDHFIPPFNALTQDTVTTLARNGVKYIHSFDVALRQRPQGAVSHPNIGGNFGGWIEDYQLPKGVLFVVSEWGKSYADVDVVGAHLATNPRGSQATLHWYYDSRKKNYAELYEDFSDVITGEG